MQILFVSLGCDKNLVDTEMMLGQLAEKGYTFTDDEAEADIAVVNSCCFIGDAKEESINTILQLAELKTEGQLKALTVWHSVTKMKFRRKSRRWMRSSARRRLIRL